MRDFPQSQDAPASSPLRVQSNAITIGAMSPPLRLVRVLLVAIVRLPLTVEPFPEVFAATPVVLGDAGGKGGDK